MGEAEGRRSKRGDSNVLEHLPRTHSVGFEKRVYKLVDVHTRASTYARYVHDGDWVMGDLARAIR